MTNKIIVVGPANSGKSVFTEKLRRSLENLNVNYGYVDLDLWGSTELLLAGKESKKERKERKKDLKVTDDMIEEKAQEFHELTDELILADTPGADTPDDISEELGILIEPATMAIIVCRKEWGEKLEKWKDYLNEKNIPIVGIVYSVVKSKENVSLNEIIEATISDLDRKKLDPSPGTESFLAHLRNKLGI